MPIPSEIDMSNENDAYREKVEKYLANGGTIPLSVQDAKKDDGTKNWAQIWDEIEFIENEKNAKNATIQFNAPEGSIIPKPSEKEVRDKYFFDRKFAPRLMADELNKEFTFIRHPEKNRNELFVYDSKQGIYLEAENFVKEQTRIRLGNLASSHATNEVYNDLLDRAGYAEYPPQTLIALENSLFDLEKETELPFSPSYFFESKFSFPFNPKATCPEYDQFLEWFQPDEKNRTILLEATAHLLVQDRLFQKANLMFYGSGQNGKGTYGRFVLGFLGKDNTAAVDMKVLDENPRFQTPRLVGKRLLYDGDMPAFKKATFAVYKRITGDDPISVERKGREPYDASIKGRFWILTNQPPSYQTHDDSFCRRTVILKCEQKFTQELANNDLEKRLNTKAEYSGLFNKLIPLFKKIQNQGNYTNAPTDEETRNTYNAIANPVTFFIGECINPEDLGNSGFKSEIYGLYCRWAKVRKQRFLTPEEFHKYFRNAPEFEGRLTTVGKNQAYEGISIKDETELSKIGLSRNPEKFPTNSENQTKLGGN